MSLWSRSSDSDTRPAPSLFWQEVQALTDQKPSRHWNYAIINKGNVPMRRCFLWLQHVEKNRSLWWESFRRCGARASETQLMLRLMTSYYVWAILTGGHSCWLRNESKSRSLWVTVESCTSVWVWVPLLLCNYFNDQSARLILFSQCILLTTRWVSSRSHFGLKKSRLTFHCVISVSFPGKCRGAGLLSGNSRSVWNIIHCVIKSSSAY